MGPARACPCDHGYPLCACHEGLIGAVLWRRANFLSSLAGWPGPLDPKAVAEHQADVAEAESRRPAPQPDHVVDTTPMVDPERLQLAETCEHRRIPECGCAGMECGPAGTQPGRRVTIGDCLACKGA